MSPCYARAVVEAGSSSTTANRRGLVPGDPRAIDWALAILLAVIAGSLYQSTLCPTVFWYDSAEYAAAAYTLGIPHPPGYPLYTWLGFLATHVANDPAVGLNAMSAGFAALAVGLCYGFGRDLQLARPAAVVAASLLAQNPIFWRNAVIAEVYTPALAWLIVVWWIAWRGWQRNRPRLLVVAAGLAGLGLGLHLFLATTGLGLALWVATVRVGPWLVRVRWILACIGATLLGACVFLWVPLRATMDPPITFENLASAERTWWMFTGGQYKYWFTADSSLTRLQGVVRILGDFVGWPGLVVAVLGLVIACRGHRAQGWAFVLAIVGNLWFFHDYRVHDLEVFFLPTSVFLALGAGFAIDAAWRGAAASSWIQSVVAVVALAYVSARVPSAFHRNDLADYSEARDWADRLVEQLPSHAVIVTYTTFPEWKYDAVFRSYYQVVLGARPDIEVWLVPPPAQIADALARGRTVFAYHPVPMLTPHFELEPVGGLYRVHDRDAPRATVDPVPVAFETDGHPSADLP